MLEVNSVRSMSSWVITGRQNLIKVSFPVFPISSVGTNWRPKTIAVQTKTALITSYQLFKRCGIGLLDLSTEQDLCHSDAKLAAERWRKCPQSKFYKIRCDLVFACRHCGQVRTRVHVMRTCWVHNQSALRIRQTVVENVEKLKMLRVQPSL